MEGIINKQGAALEMLFFMEYFKHSDLSPSSHITSLLANHAYRVESLALKDTKIEITEIGDPT